VVAEGTPLLSPSSLWLFLLHLLGCIDGWGKERDE
jgi:hypothetical protein